MILNDDDNLNQVDLKSPYVYSYFFHVVTQNRLKVLSPLLFILRVAHVTRISRGVSRSAQFWFDVIQLGITNCNGTAMVWISGVSGSPSCLPMNQMPSLPEAASQSLCFWPRNIMSGLAATQWVLFTKFFFYFVQHWIFTRKKWEWFLEPEV